MSEINPTPTMNIDPAFVSQLPEDIPPKKDNKKKIIIIVVIALLVLCCCAVAIGLIIFFISQGGGDFNYDFDFGSLLLNTVV